MPTNALPGSVHPTRALFSDIQAVPDIPCIDHYAGSEKLITKALALQATLGPVFDVTGDCEDGARAGAEAEHAEMVACMAASENNRHGRFGARIHDVTHPHWQRDLEILLAGAGDRLAFITLPKARSAADVRTQIEFAGMLRARLGLVHNIPFHVLIETHGALREVWEIASLPAVESLDFGLMDFVSAHQGAIMASAMRSPEQFSHPLVVRAKSEIVAAAIANGRIPAHNVCTELQDRELIREDARIARQRFGFLRMWSIHPNQIEPILEAMRPDFSEIEVASEILLSAQDADWGPIAHAGRLHDRASYRYYWTLLCRARSTGMALPAEALTRFFDTSGTTTPVTCDGS